MMDTQQIKHDNPLPVVLEQYGVSLRRTGQGFIGRCPFHDDRHPSFSVFLGARLAVQVLGRLVRGFGRRV
jgi:DNA primase